MGQILWTLRSGSLRGGVHIPSSQTWHLSRIGLKAHDRPTSKQEPPPALLLRQYDRTELCQKVWSEPTRAVAKHYGVSGRVVGKGVWLEQG